MSKTIRAAATSKNTRSLARFLLGVGAILLAGRACSQETYGPYNVIGYNYTDRTVYLFNIDHFGAGGSEAHASGGGGGIACCLKIPRNAKTLHFKVILDLTRRQIDEHVSDVEADRENTYETDIPVPELPNKHDGYIEVHFLPNRKIEAKWVDFPTRPHIPNATH